MDKQFIFKKNSEIQNFQTFEKKRIIFAAGRLTKQKNHELLIRMFGCNNFNEKLQYGDLQEKYY